MVMNGFYVVNNLEGIRRCKAKVLQVLGCWVLGLLLLPFPVSAQDAASALVEERPLRSYVILCSEDMEPSWVDSLLYNLGQLERLRELYLWPQRFRATGEEPLREEAAMEAAALRWGALHDYSFVLVVDRLDRESSGATASYRLVDVRSSLVRLRGEIPGPAPDGGELAELFWLPLLAELGQEEAQSALGSLVIRARPGTRIQGLSSKPLVVGPEGEGRVSLPVPGTYKWKAAAPGLRTEEGVYLFRESPGILEVQQRPSSRWLLEQGVLMGQFPDFWVHRLLLNERLWLGFGLEQYWIGIYYPTLNDVYPYTNPIISLPLIEPGITLGYRFFDDTSFLRPYLSLSTKLRINTDLFRLDPAAVLHLNANAGLEWRLGQRFATFFELGASWYPFCDGPALAASHGGESRSPSTFLYADSWYLDIPVSRLGVRFFL